ncbi:MAG: hypothetical protein RIK87_24205 [Fuerstiella sp.]
MMADSPRIPRFPAALAGAVCGAVLGFLAFSMLLKIGFYGMVLPGAMVGLGCGAQARGRSNVLGVVAAVMAIALSLWIEWHFFPFNADDSLGYFLRNVGDLKTATKLTIAAGGFAGFWFGRGR